jgi:hypothetical protein
MGVPLNVTEWMKGYVGFGATDTDAGFIEGIEQDTYFEHEVLIQIDDIDKFVDRPGVIHIQVLDGFRSARSFRSPGSSAWELAGAVKAFCGFYLGKLWDVYARVSPGAAHG